MPKGYTLSQKIAFIVSRALGPIPLLCLLWLTVAVKSGIGFWRALWVYPVIFLFTIAIPTAITTYLIATKRVKDIEWSDINERKKFLPSISAISIVLLLILTKILTNETTFHLSLVLSTIITATVAIWTIFNFKISAHIIVATGTFAAINLYFHQQLWWLFLLLILIIWARNKLKMHSLPQLIAGFIMSGIIMTLSVLLFGWPKVP